MPLAELSKRVSDDERENTLREQNPPEYEQGFEPGGESSNQFDELTSIFDSGDSAGGFNFDDTGTGGGFGSENGSGDNGNGGFGDFGGFDFGNNGGFTNTFTNPMEQKEKQPDKFDMAVDASADGLVAAGHMLVDFVKSTKNRTHDDWASIGNTTLKIGIVLIAVGLLCWFIGIASDFKPFKFMNVPINTLMWGMLDCAFGVGSLGLVTLLKLKSGDFGDNNSGSLDDIQSASSTVGFENSYDNNGFDLDSNDSDIFGGSLFDEDEDEDDFAAFLNDTLNSEKQEEKPKVEEINPDEVVGKIPENVPMLTRKFLIDSLLPLFPNNEPGFADKRIVDLSSDEGLDIIATLTEAVKTACNSKDDLKVTVTEIVDTKFSITITFKRAGIKVNTELLENEIANYFKSSVDDNSVYATINVLSGNYVATIAKGVRTIITLKDCFGKQEVKDFFNDESKRLPVIFGVDELGKIYMGDARHYPSFMICGQPRSGKSWYVSSFLLSMMAFNKPEDVQFLIIDPKSSMLFKTMALMPHVCGLHGTENVVNVLNDVLYKEAVRRKTLLQTERCETLWDLRDKGIMVPSLYIVIDEVVSVIKYMEAQGMQKEFNNLIISIITQLPSLGIGLILVPHRASGIVDKTTRTQMQFRAVVNGNTEVIKETLDAKTVPHSLMFPGDVAFTAKGIGDLVYVRSVCLTLKDKDNNDLIANIARSFYRMGVDLPDMTSLGCGYNRNPSAVQNELKIALGKNEQFTFDD